MRIARVFEKVQSECKSLSAGGRRMIRSSAVNSPDAGFCLRCKIVLNLVRGRPVQMIHAVLGCAVSQVYRIAQRFVEQGEIGLADRREENGFGRWTKITSWP